MNRTLPLKLAIIVLIGTSLVCFGWSGSYYLTTPTHPNVSNGGIHPLNNHGIIHYLTERQWHISVFLDIASVLAFFLAVFLDWFYDPFGLRQRQWEMKPPERAEEWPRPKRRPRRLPWKI
jgi:hypothetical protein